MAQCKRGDLPSTDEKELISVNKNCADALLNEAGEGRNVALGAGMLNVKPQAECASRHFQAFHDDRSIGIVLVVEQPDDFRRGNQFVKHRQPFRRQGDCEEAHAGHIAAWPVETGHEVVLDRVAPNVKDDRNRRCRGFCGLRRGDITQCGNHCDPTADQVGRERRQPVELASQAEPIHDEGRDPLLGMPRVLRPNCVGLGLPAGPLSRPRLGAWRVVRGDVAGTAIKRWWMREEPIPQLLGCPFLGCLLCLAVLTSNGKTPPFPSHPELRDVAR